MLDKTGEQSPKMPDCVPDGIYFGLDEDRYHADPALGSTDIKLLLKHPCDYWWKSWMNPKRKREENDYTKWGTAFHVLIVQGEDEFVKRYYRGPSREDYPEVLDLVEKMKTWLRLRGYSMQGNKPDLEKRILAADPDAPVWGEIMRKAEVLAEGRIILDPYDYDTIVLSSGFITKNPYCGRAFRNGQPEVSVFWTLGEVHVDDYGPWPLRCKCRIDYLKFHAMVDLKSFRNWRTKEFEVAINDTISFEGYDIQAAHYVHGRQRMPQFIREGKVFGDVPKSWLDRFLELSAEKFLWSWVFYQADGAPIARRVDYFPEADYHPVAESDINRAIERYRRYMGVYGATHQWVDVSEPRQLTTEDLRPRYASFA